MGLSPWEETETKRRKVQSSDGMHSRGKDVSTVSALDVSALECPRKCTGQGVHCDCTSVLWESEQDKECTVMLVHLSAPVFGVSSVDVNHSELIPNTATQVRQ